MWKYYALLTDLSAADIAGAARSGQRGRAASEAAKVDLATRIVGDFHSPAAAAAAAAAFEQRFAKGEIDRSSLDVREWLLPEEPRAFRQVLIQLKLAASGAEADQKLKQGAVKVDGRKVNGPFAFQSEFLRRGEEHVIEIGRRAFLLKVS